jgi:uncharacterized membrane protein YfcA
MFLNWFLIKDFQPWEIIAVICSALFIGMSKAGLNGMNTFMVPIIALVFGAKESTGIVLPMLCFADLLAVIWYRRKAEWKHIFRLLPWSLGGLVLALLVDTVIPARGFRFLIGVCIFAGLGVMFWNDFYRLRGSGQTLGVENAAVPSGWWFSALFGLMGGFSTMIGNAAGPIMSVFLLSMRLPKESFAGTAAWYYLIINYIKLPLQVFIWSNVTPRGILFNLCVFPVIIIGIILGILVVKKVSEKIYRIMIYIMTIISALLLFINFS